MCKKKILKINSSSFPRCYDYNDDENADVNDDDCSKSHDLPYNLGCYNQLNFRKNNELNKLPYLKDFRKIQFWHSLLKFQKTMLFYPCEEYDLPDLPPCEYRG
jgi:hypothetical protein